MGRKLWEEDAEAREIKKLLNGEKPDKLRLEEGGKVVIQTDENTGRNNIPANTLHLKPHVFG